jgi:hypothetical protein
MGKHPDLPTPQIYPRHDFWRSHAPPGATLVAGRQRARPTELARPGCPPQRHCSAGRIGAPLHPAAAFASTQAVLVIVNSARLNLRLSIAHAGHNFD